MRFNNPIFNNPVFRQVENIEYSPHSSNNFRTEYVTSQNPYEKNNQQYEKVFSSQTDNTSRMNDSLLFDNRLGKDNTQSRQQEIDKSKLSLTYQLDNFKKSQNIVHFGEDDQDISLVDMCNILHKQNNNNERITLGMQQLDSLFNKIADVSDISIIKKTVNTTNMTQAQINQLMTITIGDEELRDELKDKVYDLPLQQRPTSNYQQSSAQNQQQSNKNSQQQSYKDSQQQQQYQMNQVQKSLSPPQFKYHDKREELINQQTIQSPSKYNQANNITPHTSLFSTNPKIILPEKPFMNNHPQQYQNDQIYQGIQKDDLQNNQKGNHQLYTSNIKKPQGTPREKLELIRNYSQILIPQLRSRENSTDNDNNLFSQPFRMQSPKQNNQQYNIQSPILINGTQPHSTTRNSQYDTNKQSPEVYFSNLQKQNNLPEQNNFRIASNQQNEDKQQTPFHSPRLINCRSQQDLVLSPTLLRDDNKNGNVYQNRNERPRQLKAPKWEKKQDQVEQNQQVQNDEFRTQYQQVGQHSKDSLTSGRDSQGSRGQKVELINVLVNELNKKLEVVKLNLIEQIRSKKYYLKEQKDFAIHIINKIIHNNRDYTKVFEEINIFNEMLSNFQHQNDQSSSDLIQLVRRAIILSEEKGLKIQFMNQTETDISQNDVSSLYSELSVVEKLAQQERANLELWKKEHKMMVMVQVQDLANMKYLKNQYLSSDNEILSQIKSDWDQRTYENQSNLPGNSLVSELHYQKDIDQVYAGTIDRQNSMNKPKQDLKRLFYNLAVQVKLNLPHQNQGKNILIQDLYLKSIQNNIPQEQWQNFIKKEIDNFFM